MQVTPLSTATCQLPGLKMHVDPWVAEVFPAKIMPLRPTTKRTTGSYVPYARQQEPTHELSGDTVSH